MMPMYGGSMQKACALATKKKSVCPVVGDLPPIYGKFSGENDDKHGFV